MKNLQEIFSEVDTLSIDSKYLSEIADLLKIYRDQLFEEKLIDEANKIQWEIDCYHFTIRNNQLFPRASWTNEQGKIVEYPTLTTFSDEAYTYLKERLSSSKSNIIKARIAHFLWLSPSKHKEYAQAAILAHLENISHYEQSDINQPDNHYGLSVLESIKNAFYLSVSIKFETPRVKQDVIKSALSFYNESSSVYAATSRLINLMLENGKVFNNQDFNGIIARCESLVSRLKITNPHFGIDILLIIVRVAEKLGIVTLKWKIEMAEIYEDMASKRENLVAMTFIEHAITIYKELKDVKEVKRLENKYKELKKDIKLGQFGQQIDMSDIIKQFRSEADLITDKDTKSIVENLMFNPDVIPSLDYIEELIKDNAKNESFLSIIPATIIDENGHTSEYFSDPEEKHSYDLLWQFDLSVKMFRVHFIREIMIQSIKKKKLDTAQLLLLFRKHSWFGKNLTKFIPGGTEYPYNWLNLLAPSILEYFNFLDVYISNPNNIPNFILCIDSLTLKFEGLFRDICSHIGITTFFFTKDKKNRNIAKEKDINALLHEPDLNKLINESDLFFFKYLLIEKAGLNLRNKVAHSLMNIEEYAFDYATLLVIALAKLGKYDFPSEESPTQ